MAGAQLIFSVDDTQVLAMLERCRNLGLAMKEPLAQAGTYAIRRTDKHFEDQMGPVKKWDALKASTESRRRKGKKNRGNKILQDTGRLMQSVGTGKGPGHIERLDNTSFTFGTNLVYAATHQYGDTREVFHKAGIMTLRFKLNKFGLLAKQKSNKNLLRFAKKTDKFALKGDVARKAYSSTVTIPDRPFLYLTKEDAEYITNGIFGAWALKKLGGV